MFKYLKIFVLILLGSITFIGCKSEPKKNDSENKEAMEETLQVNVIGNEVSYATEDTQMKGYISYDENKKGKRPGVIVVHEWWGHNDYTRERADMLAELGYVALAIDMYGDGKQAQHPEDAGKFSGMVMQNIDIAKARFDAAMTVLKADPHVNADEIAAIGYCFGGSVVLTMANLGKDLNAVAAFHSGVQLPVMPNEDLKAKILVCNGAADPFVSPESVTAYKAAMDSVNADYKYIAYPDAQHAFTSKEADSLGKKFNLPLAYQKEADEKSWAELKSLLSDTFKQ
ncbi:dienelactone hydrolase [Sediminicola sp. YIK13]|uniref:dienelactone hydrolase family protein n=1 Tax=Sediminicola sp. YIK13 TaxID=1453352 RepID=UPI0007223138|nr:dienelactone hydrolase family protein [Sediminicola sp. YIK13]ALM07051.1 dienelactone hydrolase [Sediminicola sp. YIK13]